MAVDGISATSATEAVVRATIAGSTTNLKFRRFDTGWTWEFVETKAGGWVSPDVAIGQIREENRAVAAAAWAEQNKAAYTKTASTMYLVSLWNAPNPTQRERYDEYLRNKKLVAQGLKQAIPTSKDRARTEESFAVITSDR